MDRQARALERQAALGDPDAAARLAALERRVVPEPEYGLILAGHALDRLRLRRTIQLVAELTGRSEAEAEELCRDGYVTVFRHVTKEVAEAAERRFQALGVTTRVTCKARP